MALGSFEGLLGILADLQKLPENARPLIEDAAQRTVADAQGRLGFYQSAEGVFPAWEDLAESTQQERERLGYPPDDPLLRTGTLRDDITYSMDADGMGATVGVPLGAQSAAYAAAQEMGTDTIPERPFLRPAAQEQAINLVERLKGQIKTTIG